jgi:hypothetical protein
LNRPCLCQGLTRRCIPGVVAFGMFVGSGAPSGARALDPAADLEAGQLPITDAYGMARGPRVLRHFELGFAAQLRYTHELTPSLRVPLHEGGSDLGTPIVARFGARIGVALGLFDRLELSVALPLVLLQAGEPFSDPQVRAALPIEEGAGLGDLAVRVQGLLHDDTSWSIAVALDSTLPTGRQEILAGERSATFTPVALAAVHAAPVDVMISAGARLRVVPALLPDARTIEHELRGALAARIALGDDVAAGLSLEGRLPFRSFEQGYAAAVEGQLFVAGTLHGDDVAIDVEAAGSSALPRTYGAPSGRGAVGARVRIDLGVRDEDSDGIADARDRCPMTPEARNGLEDEDGCPEADGDHDGVPDTADLCLDLPGGDGGRGGCPAERVDEDRDGIPDVRDTCPTAAEDTDGFDDEDGCPEDEVEDDEPEAALEAFEPR